MEEQIKAFCQANGVPFEVRGERFRVMDVTQLPMAMRETCDERGFVTTAVTEIVIGETNDTDTQGIEEVSGTKRRSKARH